MPTIKKFSLKDFRGFTLVELLVVIAIIGILSTLILVQLGTARSKARDTKRIADVNQLQIAVEQFYDDNGGVFPGIGAAVGGYTGVLWSDISKYMNVAAEPLDPLTKGNYGYAIKSATTPRSYQLWTELEQNNPGTSGDADINSTNGGAGALSWTTGDLIIGATETCTTYVAGTSKQCIYDIGQK